MSNSRISPSVWWGRLTSEQRALACDLAKLGEFTQSDAGPLELQGRNPELADYLVHLPNSDKVAFAQDVAEFLRKTCPGGDA